MREIGSEFWDVPTTGKVNQLFPESVHWFLSGRSALHAIINELHGCHTVSIPSWCCDSMIKPFTDHGIEVRFYPVYWQNGLVQEINRDSDILFLMDYFGYTGQQPDLSGFKGVIIRDVTHSILSAAYNDADYYFGSLRKWCGIRTGGYAWTQDSHCIITDHWDEPEEASLYNRYISLREKAMNLKNIYIHNMDITDKSFLSIFGDAENILEQIGIATGADRDITLAHQMDAAFIKSRRRANAGVLCDAFPEWLIFREMRDSDCPMFVPILVPNGRRDEMRKYLIENSIYCPVHWPVSEYHKLSAKEKYIYDNELSLVCDQRYSEKDMKHMAETVKEYWKEA